MAHGGSRADELRREGSAVRRLLVVTTAAVLLLSAGLLGVQSQGSPAQAASNCNGFSRLITYRDESERLLAYFQMSQKWCWNFSAITYVSKPTVAGKVTKLGAARGWRYDGLLIKNDYYFAYKGLSRGGHTSIRKGGFRVCAKNNQCYQKAPWVKINVYYDAQGFSVARA